MHFVYISHDIDDHLRTTNFQFSKQEESVIFPNSYVYNLVKTISFKLETLSNKRDKLEDRTK